jgi:putative ABC transport system permease protein
MTDLLGDVRHAIRGFLRTPGFTAAAVLTLALGIGANTAIFSVVDGVLLRPAPFAAMDRLAMVWETDRKSGTTREPASVPDYLDFQQRSRTFARLAAFAPAEVSLTPDRGDPERLAALAVSHEFLPLVGIRPLVGRVFNAEEDRPGAPRTVMISEDLWTQRFGRDPALVGRTIKINDVSRTVIGVLPRSADFGVLQILGAAAYGRGFAERGDRVRVDVWAPLAPDPAGTPRDTHPIFVVGRLTPAGSVRQAQQEMGGVAADLERAYPDANDGRGVTIEPLGEVVFGPVKPALLVLLGAVALVLLVACANVASLLLARGTARLHDVTVRVALGASAARLARQFLVESAVLTVAGALLGVALAVQGLGALLALAPAVIPRVDTVGIDGRVLAVTLGVSAVVALAFGILPIVQVRSLDPHTGLQGGGRTSTGREHRRLRASLVMSQLALAVMLMVGAGLLIRSFWRLEQVDPGFRAEGVLKAEYQLPASRYPRDFAVWPVWPEQRRFNDELERRVAALPGVTAVAIATSHPLDAGFTSSIAVVGREAEARDWPEPSLRLVSMGYLATLGVPLRDGRGLAAADDAGAAPVVVINEAARARFFGDRPALGQRIRLWGAERLVVGVVGNERFHGLAEATPPGLYLPLAQVPSAGGAHSLMLRVRGDPAALTAPVRAIVRDLDPGLPLFGVEPLALTLSHSVGQRRFTMLVLGLFAAVALLLAAVGVHGVLSYTVAQRTREIGIRMALGADRRAVGSLVVSQGVRLTAGGLVAGLAGALALSRVLVSLLYGVGAGDPLTFAGVALVLGAVALFACWLPAWRASRVDPMVALRAD